MILNLAYSLIFTCSNILIISHYDGLQVIIKFENTFCTKQQNRMFFLYSLLKCAHYFIALSLYVFTKFTIF